MLLRHGSGGSSLSALASEMVIDSEVGGAPTGRIATESGKYGHVTLANPEDQPWSVILTWLELRHHLAVVALLQVRARCARRRGGASVVWNAA